jgi:putative ABC transport system permease protein
MYKNYLKIAWRNLLKNKAFSFINILGLAIGLSGFILITLYVVDELSFDRFNTNADRIYRVDGDIVFGGNELNLAVASDPMGATLKKDYPQVEEYVRFYRNGSKTIQKGSEYIVEQEVAYADSTLFNVFTLPSIAGDTKTALNEPNAVVITASTAEKYFNSIDAVGKTLLIDRNPFKVTAVIRDIPKNSHFRFDMFLSMDNADYGWGNYLSNNHNTYILLKRGTDYRIFEKNFDAIIEKYIFPQAQQFMQISSMKEFEKAGNKLKYHLLPLTKIHLHSDRMAELGANGDIRYVLLFSVVAIIILLLACINFMNLSTARSANRAREVGIRKVLGTGKNNLISQFLTESVLTTALSLLLAIGAAILALPLFNEIAAKELTISEIFKPYFIIFLISIPVIVGIIAGSYPAFFLARFQPIKVLKASGGSSVTKKSRIRSTLVVVQFTMSVLLIICTIVVFQQLHFIQTQKLGFSKDQVLVINETGALGTNAEAFKNEVLKMPQVVSGTFSSYLPVNSSSRSDNSFSKEAVMTSENGFNMQAWVVDENYVPTMGMEMAAGRNFSKDFPGDSSAIIINETSASLLGYANPIGQKIYGSDDGLGDTKPLEIIGVVKNFHFESIRQNVGPLSLRLGRNTGTASFKLRPGNTSEVINKAESLFKSMAGGVPFSYRFLDQAFDQMYRTEQRFGVIVMTFSILAIFIACLGLFGLAAYMAEQRTKEIGIRKVLGASVSSITQLLSRDFIILVVLSSVIAFPLAWWAMHSWLQDFSIRVDIKWWVFAVAFFAAVGIALVTVSFQAIRAALANPVKSLRSE